MSVNLDPDMEISVSPAELYLALQWNAMLSKALDMLEKEGFTLIQRWGERRFKAFIAITILLFSGKCTRSQLIEVVEECGYSRSYAEKFVDRYLKLFKKRLPEEAYRLEAEQEEKRGRWGKPHTKGGAGRPALRFGVRETGLPCKSTPLYERLQRIMSLIMLLSGNTEKFYRLVFKLAADPRFGRPVIEGLKEVKLPWIRTLIEEVDRVKEEPTILEEKLGEVFGRVLEPVRKRADRIVARLLGTELTG